MDLFDYSLHNCVFYLNQFLKIDDKCSKMVSKYSLNMELTVYSSTRFVIKHRACTWNRYNILVNGGTESIEVIHCSALGWLQTIWLACIKRCFVGTLVISIGHNKVPLILKTTSGPHCPKQRKHKPTVQTFGQNITLKLSLIIFNIIALT